MKRKSLSLSKENENLKRFAKKIKSRKYFRKISLLIIEKILKKGDIVEFNKGEVLVTNKKSNYPQLIILLKGSLVVTSKKTIILSILF